VQDANGQAGTGDVVQRVVAVQYSALSHELTSPVQDYF
jgi:hypothetical protein